MTPTTIVAPATPHGIGGIAVVRLSGSLSISILHKLLNNSGLTAKIRKRVATLFNIYDQNARHIDEVVVTFFESPHSYTGEDVVELSCHGSPLIVERIVSACLSHGADLAGPGEFTRRAFINGKIDLIQAEAVASLIKAKSEESSSLNLKLLSGDLSNKISTIRNLLIKAASFTEFELDISEEELQPDIVKKIADISENVRSRISRLLKSYKQARLLNSGALVVIAGEPNVGKSTLLNALTESNRAIVSAKPGTTRDAIDVPYLIDGVPINLIDTAGIRTTNEEIESEGVRRTHDYIDKADLVLLVQDNTSSIKNNVNISEKEQTIIIHNKSDLLDPGINKSSFCEHKGSLLVSAKTGDGLDVLKNKIKDALGISESISNTLSITTSRQNQALEKCHKNMFAINALLNEQPVSYELVSIELREALDSLGSILGKTTPDDIINNIFNQFCVGK